AQMGIPIRKIAVSELPEQLIGKDSPFSPKDSMPFGVEKLSGNLRRKQNEKSNHSAQIERG
ncbi:MAG: hypothetical protein K2N00_09620, partial [Lachnospiraceae bacterium]|nr:hypothetical protein [Lachnospiraceae bacterium]